MFLYRCNFEVDNGYSRENDSRVVVSKYPLDKDEIEKLLYTKKPYSDYETYIENLRIIPIVLMNDAEVL